MQRRNFMLFMVLALFILVGWMWLQMKIWPHKPRPKEEPTVQPKKQPPKELLAVRLAATHAPDLTGLVNRALLAMEMATAEKRVVPTDAEVRRKLTAAQGEALDRMGALFVPLAGDLGAALHHLRLVWKPPREREAVSFVMGGPGYHIRAEVTTKGGGIRNLSLLRFQKADDYGKPVFDPITKEKVPLELIQDDDVVASFLMYHYLEDKEDRDKYQPVATLGQRIWHVDRAETSTVVLWCDKLPKYEHLKIRKIYTLAPGDYHIGLSIEIEDTRPAADKKEMPKFRYQLAGARGTRIEGEWYTATYRHPLIGTVDGSNNLWRQDVETGLTQQRISGKKGGDRFPEGNLGDSFIHYLGVQNQYYASLIVVDDQQVRGVDRKRMLDYVRPTLESEEKPVKVRRIDIPKREMVLSSREKAGGEQTYKLLPRVVTALQQQQIREEEEIFVSVYDAFGEGLVVTDFHRGRVERPHRDDISVRGVSVPIELKAGDKVVHKYLLYNGPVKVDLLSQFSGDEGVDSDLVKRYNDLHLSTMTDYRSAGPFGWFAQKIMFTKLLIFFTWLMHQLFYYLQLVVLGNYGLSIILLTVVVRGLMFPISRKQAQISVRMQELAPEMKKLQEKYKSDPQGKHQAMMELYRKHGVNPLGGCLPLFLQLPIFLSLYYALQESIHFRLASFLWIDNLAAPDMLFPWGEGIPWLTDPDNIGSMLYLGPYLNLLPFFAVALMVVQQKLMTPPPADEQQAFQQKMMKWMMIFFGVLFYKVAAGLCIYFIASSLWGLAERRLLPKRRPMTSAAATSSGDSKPPTAAPSKPPTPAKGKQRGGKKEKQTETAMSKVKSWWQDILKKAAEKK